MGKYPVINLSLKSGKQPNFQLALKCIKDELVDEFRRHNYVLDSDKLNEEKEKYLKIAKAEDALKQIEAKGYDMELRSEGYKNIIRYGISFCEKDCYIIMK